MKTSRMLVESWKMLQSNLKGAVAPTKIMSEQTKTTSMLRDLLNEDFNKIVINDRNIYNDTKSYIQRIAPDKVDIVAYYHNGSPIFDSYGVTKQVKAAFGKTVNLASGAYLIIEHTEALHVIDVNSGYKSVSNNQEQNALETNMEAAEEIARQLRLRDLGGIIVVDFIDMKFPDNKKAVMDSMEKFMATDRAKHAILAISKFGLMQITRQRMRPEVNINTLEICPTCNGTGKITSTLILEDEIEKNLNYLIMHQHNDLIRWPCTLSCTPGSTQGRVPGLRAHANGNGDGNIIRGSVSVPIPTIISRNFTFSINRRMR